MFLPKIISLILVYGAVIVGLTFLLGTSSWTRADIDGKILFERIHGGCHELMQVIINKKFRDKA